MGSRSHDVGDEKAFLFEKSDEIKYEYEQSPTFKWSCKASENYRKNVLQGENEDDYNPMSLYTDLVISNHEQNNKYVAHSRKFSIKENRVSKEKSRIKNSTTMVG